MTLKYSMTIRWSDEDDTYLVWLPEFDPKPGTHGATYEEAARRGQELIESHLGWLAAEGKPAPDPGVYVDPDVPQTSTSRPVKATA